MLIGTAGFPYSLTQPTSMQAGFTNEETVMAKKSLAHTLLKQAPKLLERTPFARSRSKTLLWRTSLLGGGLLVTALVGGATYAYLKTRRELASQRVLDEKEAKSRWENEGGASSYPNTTPAEAFI